MKHRHAELMMEYARDAMETDKPWERWEFKFEGRWIGFIGHPAWGECFEYRRKPRTININGFEVPEPVRKRLGDKQRFWLVDIKYSIPVSEYVWKNDTIDYSYLENGLIHLSKEAAIKHAEALLSFTRIEK